MRDTVKTVQYRNEFGTQPICGRYMRKSIARISLAVFIVVAASTLFMPAMSGSFVPIFGFLIIVSITMVIIGTKKFKIIGVACLLVSVTLLISDYRAGKEYQAKVQKQIDLIESKKKEWSNGI